MHLTMCILIAKQIKFSKLINSVDEFIALTILDYFCSTEKNS